MAEAVIVGYRRTPFVPMGGALRSVPATQLGALALKGVLDATSWDPAAVDYVWMGQVIQAGAGQIPSRQATVAAGIPLRVPSETVNKVCASSLRAVNLADALIRSGDIQVALAGGMESMSGAPFLLPGARYGFGVGNQSLVDAVIHDGLWDSFGNCHMGFYGDDVAKEFGISREDQDAWAFRSHQRAIAAIDRGRLQREIVPVTVEQGKGKAPDVVATDLAPRRDTSPEKMARLKPAFVNPGTVTAGNSPGLTDGAAALLVMERSVAEAAGLPILARIVSQGQVSEAPRYLHTVPARAGQRALDKVGLKVADLELLEINEAFAAVTLTSMRLLGCDPERVNVNGGAVALGHPIGASGARILGTLVMELMERGGGYGLAAICSGGGQGEATLIQVD